MYWGGIKPNVQQRTAEHELHLSTQAADAMPSSIKTSCGEDGPEESDDEVDDAEDHNDHINLCSRRICKSTLLLWKYNPIVFL